MRNLFLIILFVLPLWGRAQYAESIRSGRPGAAFGPFTVGSKVFQVQSGVNLGAMAWDPEQKVSNVHGTAVFRYGLLERLEISSLLAYSKISWSSLENFQSDQKGLSAAQIGFRVNIRNGQGKGPNIGFQSRLKLNVLDEDFEQPLLAAVNTIAVGQKLGRKLGLLINLGINTSGNHDEDPSGLYAVNLSMPIGTKTSVFIENYGLFNDELHSTFDTGLGYLVNNNFQLDASIGYGKNHGVEDYFADIGFSWRLVGIRALGHKGTRVLGH